MTYTMISELADAIRDKIGYERERCDLHEACGLVFDDGSIRVLENESDDPEHSYAVSPRALSFALLARKSSDIDGPLAVGIYHSHVNESAEPSAADTKQLVVLSRRNNRPLMFIYGTDGLRCWTFDENLVEIDLGG